MRIMVNRWVKHLSLLIGICALLLSNPIISNAEANKTAAADYMKRGIRGAYHNMHLIYEAYYDEEGNLEMQPAGHVAIEQEWDGNGNLLSRTYIGTDGEPIGRVDGYSRMIWEQRDDGSHVFVFYDAEGNVIPKEKDNLAKVEISLNKDGWSDWMKPENDEENKTFTIAKAVLSDKQVGDEYICSVEIEFKGVRATNGRRFSFWTQGSIDGAWDHWTENVWNREIVNLTDAPADGVYVYNTINKITKNTVDSNVFSISFRCDYWNGGEFRVRNVQVETMD